MRVCDLADVFADLDLRDDVAVLVLDGCELVHAAEHRLAARGDEPLAHAEAVDLRALPQQPRDQALIERVGHGDLAVGPAGVVEHFARLFRQVGDVAGVEADAAARDAQRLEHLVEGADGVRHAGLQAVVGVHEQGGVVRIGLAVGAEGVELGVEHLHPGVCHRAAGVHAVHLVRDRAGGAGTAADVSGARAEDRPVGTLRAARAELEHRASLCGAADAAGLRGNQALVVDLQQQVRLHKLRLNGRGAHRDERLTREHGRALRHGPDITGEAEVFQIVQKCLTKQLPAAQIGNILVGEVQVLDVVDDLLETGGDGVAAVVGHAAEEYIEVGDAILHIVVEITVAHRQLIKIAEHGHVQRLVGVH